MAGAAPPHLTPSDCVNEISVKFRCAQDSPAHRLPSVLANALLEVGGHRGAHTVLAGAQSVVPAGRISVGATWGFPDSR